MLVETSCVCWSAGAFRLHASFSVKLTRGNSRLVNSIYAILPTLSDDSQWNLGHGEAENTTNGTRSKSTERTLMMASDGHDCKVWSVL